jgi:hypothetical protein
MDKGDAGAISQHLKALREEIAQIREADRRYETEAFHHATDRAVQKERVLRLEQIMEELASLSRKKLERKKAGPRAK